MLTAKGEIQCMNKLRHFFKDNHAAIFAWVVAFVMIFTYSVIWFTAGFAAMKVVDTAEEQFEFEDRATNTIDLVKTIVAYHPIIVIVGYLLFAFVSSQRRDVRIDAY